MPTLARPLLKTLGKAVLAAACVATVAWPLAETARTIEARLPWKYVRWGLVLDEQSHYGQILCFLVGKDELFRFPGESYPANAMLPGFHALMAAIGLATGWTGPRAMRFACFGVSLAGAAVAYAIARREVGRDLAALRAAQAYFLPLAFPFHFLIYTDILALTVALAAFLACMHRRWGLCGALGIVALLVRQTNVVFLGFLLAYSYVDANGWRISAGALARHAARCWPLGLGVAAFLAFVAAHGRVGLDDPTQHPLTASSANPAFSLVGVGVLFLPWHLARVPELAGWVRRHRPAALGLALAAVALGMAQRTLHPWNITLDFLYRNRVLTGMASEPLGRPLASAAIVAAVLSLACTPLASPAAYVLYPYWVLALLPSWLVDPRYHILPFTLLILLRKPGPIAAEVALLVWFLGWSLFLWYGMTRGGFLP